MLYAGPCCAAVGLDVGLNVGWAVVGLALVTLEKKNEKNGNKLK